MEVSLPRKDLHPPLYVLWTWAQLTECLAGRAFALSIMFWLLLKSLLPENSLSCVQYNWVVQKLICSCWLLPTWSHGYCGEDYNSGGEVIRRNRWHTLNGKQQRAISSANVPGTEKGRRQKATAAWPSAKETFSTRCPKAFKVSYASLPCPPPDSQLICHRLWKATDEVLKTAWAQTFHNTHKWNL